MRSVAMLAVGAMVVATGCKRDAAEDVADRGWAAHEAVVVAGERARTCADAGREMQHEFFARHDDFVAAVELDNDPARMERATAWLEAHADRYRGLEDRMAALSDRCASDPTVTAVFAAMENPLGK